MSSLYIKTSKIETLLDGRSRLHDLGLWSDFPQNWFFGVTLWRRHVVIPTELILIFWYTNTKSDILNISSLYHTFLYCLKIFTPLVKFSTLHFSFLFTFCHFFSFLIFCFTFLRTYIFRVKNWSRWKMIQDFLDKFSILRNKLQPENSINQTQDSKYMRSDRGRADGGLERRGYTVKKAMSECAKFWCCQRQRRTKGRGSRNFPTSTKRLVRATVVHIGISRSYFLQCTKGSDRKILIIIKLQRVTCQVDRCPLRTMWCVH